jgi:Tol biopolymer transport system component/DNA-binding winged helix-turn-helix (wHTH) protein
VNDKDALLPVNAGDVGSFLLGDRLVEPSLNRISRDGEPVQVEPRIMHVLTCLADRAGEVVSRAELLDTVWTKVLVNEEALTHAISQLRKVLDDDPRSPSFIETIHKTGYRLIAPVKPLVTAVDAPRDNRGPTAILGGHGKLLTRRLGVILGGSAVVIAAIAAMAILPGLRSSSPPTPVPLENVPFTSFPGSEICPAISPDGSRVIFSWRETDEGNYDLFMKQRNTETPLRLTETPGNEYYAVWSPDGTECAYALYAEEDRGVYIMPALGGAPRKVIDIPHGIGGIDWSPDGHLLAYASREHIGQPVKIFVYSLATGESRPLTSPIKNSGGDYYPAFSPDGKHVAFCRRDRTGLQDIFVAATEGGEPERLTYSQHYIAGLDWLPDGNALIFSSGATRAADLRLWRLSLDDGSLTWLPTTTHRPVRPSVALGGRGLVYEESSVESDILRTPVGNGAGEAVPVIASTRHDYGPQYSPGGNFIAFISTRTGRPQVWICEKDGGDPRQLTQFESAYIENPCWSYDERYLAFSAAAGNHIDIYVADIRTGRVDRLTTSSRHEKCLGWSRDGEWLYCKSDRDGAWWVWKMRVGGSEIVDIMEKDVFRLAESPDGMRLTYSRADTSGVWTVSVDGTGERCLIDEPGIVVPCGWRETEKGIYFFNMEERALSLCFKDGVTGESSKLASGGDFFAINLDVSPSGNAVIFDRQEPLGVDLALVEHF